MKKIIHLAAPLILVLMGLSLLAYPPICQGLYKFESEKVIAEYEKRLEDGGKDCLEELYQLALQYNKTLFEDKQKNLVDPFCYEQVDFSLKMFGFAEDMIGHLFIPKMGIRLPIYLGANKENLRKGAAHLTQTSIPIGGINSNAVIAAHRGMNTASMFRDIEKLAINDEITITNFRESLRYRVAEIKIIHPIEIDEILIQENRDLVTLITCHPYRKNYQRYVVYCERALR